MQSITNALRKGFAGARIDRMNEWSEIRREGFVKHWLRRWFVTLTAVSIGPALATLKLDEPLGNQIIKALLMSLAFVSVFGLFDYLGWRRNESEWQEVAAH